VKDQAELATPRLAEGVELIGKFEGSGYKDPPYLARRSDGQVIQLPHILYLIAEAADGSTSIDAMAPRVSREAGRELAADDVAYLIEEKLKPLGVLRSTNGDGPELEKLDPLLALKFRTRVVPERVVRALTTPFLPLFWPVVVVAVIAGVAWLDRWLFFEHGIAQSVRQALYRPEYLLVILGLVIAAAAFHEIGHATACRYGGAKPGVMGVGLYLAWPAFYTDVTDAYRLGKRGRLRTDFGGIYFNLIFILGIAGVYRVTHTEALLLLIAVLHIEILHQLLPLLRLDGYYIVADLTGVPDLFTRIGPIFRSLIPGRGDKRVRDLKPWVRAFVTIWVVLVVPLLLFNLSLLIIHAPRIYATAGSSLASLWHKIGRSFGAGNSMTGALAIIQFLVLLLPLVGIALLLYRLTTRTSRSAWRWSEGNPVRRAIVAIAGALILAAILWAWIPPRHYVPIRPGERGTFSEGVAAIRGLAPGNRSQLPGLSGVPGRASASPSASASPAATLGATSAPVPGASGSPTPSVAPTGSASPSPSPSPSATGSPT